MQIRAPTEALDLLSLVPYIPRIQATWFPPPPPPFQAWWDTPVSLSVSLSVSCRRSLKLTSEMFLTPPRPPIHPPRTRPAPDGKCGRILKGAARRFTGCCSGGGAEGMKYSCSPKKKKKRKKKKEKRMDTPGRRACRFIQLKTRPHYTAGGEAGHGDFL